MNQIEINLYKEILKQFSENHTEVSLSDATLIKSTVQQYIFENSNNNELFSIYQVLTKLRTDFKFILPIEINNEKINKEATLRMYDSQGLNPNTLKSLKQRLYFPKHQ